MNLIETRLENYNKLVRYRGFNVPVVAAAGYVEYSNLLPTGVLSIEQPSGVKGMATVTVPTSHNWVAGEQFKISGAVMEPRWNGTWRVFERVSSTQFTFKTLGGADYVNETDLEVGLQPLAREFVFAVPSSAAVSLLVGVKNPSGTHGPISEISPGTRDVFTAPEGELFSFGNFVFKADHAVDPTTMNVFWL